MNFLIKLVGKVLARQIEQGSRAGAFVGAFVGLAASVLIVMGLNASGQLDTYRYAMFIILGVLFVIPGALIGAKFGPRSVPPDGRLGVRLTNYNHATPPLIIGLVLMGLFVLLLFAPEEKKRSKGGEDGLTPTQNLMLWIGGPIVTAIAAYTAFQMVWSVELGSVVTIRRLLRARQYNLREVGAWGFEVDGKSLGKEPFSGKAELRMEFNDGKSVAIPIDGAYSAAVVRTLAG